MVRRTVPVFKEERELKKLKQTVSKKDTSDQVTEILSHAYQIRLT
jgi:hypothetical protein